MITGAFEYKEDALIGMCGPDTNTTDPPSRDLSRTDVRPKAETSLNRLYLTLGDFKMNRRTNRRCFELVFALVLVLLAQATMAQTWTSAGPLPRFDHSAVLDSITNRMITFGGSNSPNNSSQPKNFNDVWRLNGATLAWTRVNPNGTRPTGRNGHSAVYDPGSNRMVIFGGGLGFSSPCANDVWVLKHANGDGGKPAWTQLNPGGGSPAPRLRHTAVYDSTNNRMIVFGGNDCFSTNFGDVWVLSNANGLGGTPTWKQLNPSGSPGTAEDSTAVYDPGSNSMIVFGGTLGGSATNQVWVLSNANGLGGTPTWTQLSPSGTLPPGRNEPRAVYDANNNLMTIFGGNNATGALGDVWVLSNANGSGGTPTWTQLGPFSFFAEARTAHSAVYNPSTNSMTIFGGITETTTNGSTNDVWVLSHANGK